MDRREEQKGKEPNIESKYARESVYIFSRNIIMFSWTSCSSADVGEEKENLCVLLVDQKDN